MRPFWVPSRDLEQALPYDNAQPYGLIQDTFSNSAQNRVLDPSLLMAPAFLPYPVCTGSAGLPPPAPLRGMVHFDHAFQGLRQYAPSHNSQQPAGHCYRSYSQPPMPEQSSYAACRFNRTAQPLVGCPQESTSAIAATDCSRGVDVSTGFGVLPYPVPTGNVRLAPPPRHGMVPLDSFQPDLPGLRQSAPCYLPWQPTKQCPTQPPMPQCPPTATRCRFNANARPFVESGRASAPSPAPADNSKGRALSRRGSLSSLGQPIATGKHVCPFCKKHVSGSNARTQCQRHLRI